MSIIGKFSEAIALLKPSAPLVVGVSGGVDSMALLELLSSFTKEIIVAHFNHQLRGCESDGDEKFVGKAAKRLGLEFRAGRGDVRAAATGISIEMAARNLRHQFLAEVARENRADIVLAHHANDQIELYLMRQARGIHGPGLAGMHMAAKSPANPSVRILRPLLTITREEIEAFAHEQSIQFREDSSNARLDTERNRVRHKIIPGLREARGPDFEKEMLQQIDAVWAHQKKARTSANRWLASGGDFQALDSSQKSDILAIQLEQRGIEVTGSLLQELSSKPGSLVSIDPARRAKVTRHGKLQIIDSASDATLPLDLTQSGQVEFAGATLRWRCTSAADLSPRPQLMFFDADHIGPRATLRHPHPGDRIQLLGRGSERPLLDVMARNKIPHEDRRHLIIGATPAGSIFWVERLRMTEQFKVTGRTRRFLEWRWTRG